MDLSPKDGCGQLECRRALRIGQDVGGRRPCLKQPRQEGSERHEQQFYNITISQSHSNSRTFLRQCHTTLLRNLSRPVLHNVFGTG